MSLPPIKSRDSLSPKPSRYPQPGAGTARVSSTPLARPHLEHTGRMCQVEDVIYAGCNHWGPENNYAPCAAAVGARNLSNGCSYRTKTGSVNRNGVCPSCAIQGRRRRHDQRLERFSFDVSEGAKQEMRQRLHLRRLAFLEDSQCNESTDMSIYERRR